MMRLLWAAAGLAAVGWAGGCAPTGRRVVMTQVRGAVTSDGKPAAEGTIRFHNANTGEAPEADLRPDGTYELTLPEASYAVSVVPPTVRVTHPDGSSDTKYKAVANIPAKYRDPAKSGLTAEVGKATAFDFALTK